MTLTKYFENRENLLSYAQSSIRNRYLLPNSNSILLLCSICFNLFHLLNNHKLLTKTQKQKIQSFKTIIEFLAYPNTNLTEKKAILRSKISAKKRSHFIFTIIKLIDYLISKKLIK